MGYVIISDHGRITGSLTSPFNQFQNIACELINEQLASSGNLKGDLGAW